MTLTSGFLVVGGNHHRERQRRRIRQTGEWLLQAHCSLEVLLLLITPQIHHPSSDMGNYNKLQSRPDMSDSTVLQHPNTELPNYISGRPASRVCGLTNSKVNISFSRCVKSGWTRVQHDNNWGTIQ